MTLIRLSEPNGLPVTVAEMRADRRLVTEEEDAILLRCIKAATGRLGRHLGRELVDTTYELRLTGLLCKEIEIPLPPTREILSIVYLDEDEAEQTIDSADYRFISGGNWISIVQPKPNGSWPTGLVCRPDAVRIRFRAGWIVDDAESPPDPAAEMPWEIKQAVSLLVGHYYENREEILLTPVRQELQQVPEGVAELVSTWRVPMMG